MHNTTPSVEHILTLFDDDVLGAIVKGHILIEALLVQYISFKLSKKNVKGKFQRLIAICKVAGLFKSE